MMNWLQTIDAALFRVVNQSLANPVFDWLMPKLGGHQLFVATLLAVILFLLCKGGRRGRLLVLFLVLGIALADGLACSAIKKVVDRPRPSVWGTGALYRVECPTDSSMPSSQAAVWFAVAMVGCIYYRRSWRVMVPVAALGAFSRVYNGVDYPSDVLAGAIVGAGCAAATVWSGNELWHHLGHKWFPLWWQAMPSLLTPERTAQEEPGGPLPETSCREAQLEQHWLRLGYLLTAGMLLFRLGYLASDVIELSNDEAYQWLWSKHLALSYYSKPLGIAFIQFAGTSLWGDTQLGVRFFSPVFAAILSLVVLRFLARELGARQALLLLLIITSAPLMSVGSILMTIDPPLVLCWTLALVAGWRAAQAAGTTRDWLWVGLAAGLGFLCKYSAAYLIVCWSLFFLLWPPARAHLRKPGPYLALLIFGLCTLPVIIWNAQHGWITVRHVAGNAGVASQWHPTLRFFWEFIGIQVGLLNPVFLVGALWAMAGFWKHRQQNPIELYFFCLGGVVFLGHWAYALHSRIMPNWVAPAVLPMYCLMVSYWSRRWRNGLHAVKGWLVTGLVLGLGIVALMHQSDLIGKLAGYPLPGDADPLRRVRGYRAAAGCVEQARQKLLQEGKPTFIICDHYGITGLFTFYLAEARQAVGSKPLVYCMTSYTPNNQLFFWPEYRYANLRKGENAIFATEPSRPRLERTWPWKWLTGQEVGFASVTSPGPTPLLLLREFDSVTDLGVHDIKVDGRIYKRVQLFECRNLR
jgi:4-amino-4-deoxy-L-arabinose transferase-like glycosyltransferase/membrane-associated phospholipid phosphatase